MIQANVKGNGKRKLKLNLIEYEKWYLIHTFIFLIFLYINIKFINKISVFKKRMQPLDATCIHFTKIFTFIYRKTLKFFKN